MNDLYLYQWKNGLQFLSAAGPDIIKLAYTSGENRKLKLIGVWRYKKVHLPDSDTSMFRS